MTTGNPGFVHRYEAGADSAARTLLLLHGTGGDENDLWQLGALLEPGANRLSPRGKVLEHGMPRFFRRLAEGIFDEEDLKFRTQELADFVTAAAKEYGFAPQAVTAVGFSNGANIAASVLLLRPEIFASAILFHPMVPLVPEQSPDLSGVHVLISAGKSDPIVMPQETERLANMLRDAEAKVDVAWYEGGHSLMQPELAHAKNWLAHLAKQREAVP